MPGGRRTLLTAEVSRVICEAIRKGSFGWVAAESAGVSARTFFSWLERGREEEDGSVIDADAPEGGSVYVQFLRAVREAQAKARTDAEARVFKKKPDVWLLRGPGRDHPDRPGWALPHQDEHAAPARTLDQALEQALEQLDLGDRLALPAGGEDEHEAE